MVSSYLTEAFGKRMLAQVVLRHVSLGLTDFSLLPSSWIDLSLFQGISAIAIVNLTRILPSVVMFHQERLPIIQMISLPAKD